MLLGVAGVLLQAVKATPGGSIMMTLFKIACALVFLSFPLFPFAFVAITDMAHADDGGGGDGGDGSDDAFATGDPDDVLRLKRRRYTARELVEIAKKRKESGTTIVIEGVARSFEEPILRLAQTHPDKAARLLSKLARLGPKDRLGLYRAASQALDDATAQFRLANKFGTSAQQALALEAVTALDRLANDPMLLIPAE